MKFFRLLFAAELLLPYTISGAEKLQLDDNKMANTLRGEEGSHSIPFLFSYLSSECTALVFVVGNDI